MQKYVLAHSASDPNVGPHVDGRRLSMARLGQQIVNEPLPLAGPPKPSRRRHFADAEQRIFDLSQAPENRRGVRSIPAPYPANPSPLESAAAAAAALRLRPPKAAEPAQRESEERAFRRVRKPVDGIAKWQQIEYDLVNPNCLRYEDDFDHRRRDEDPPEERARSAVERFKAECFGGGAGASMGLLRQIFRRFDANGDGSLSRDELRLALEGRNRDVTRFEDFWRALDRDHDGRVSLLELARAVADDAPDAEALVEDTSMAPAGESPTEITRRRRDGGAIAQWQQVDYDILAARQPNSGPSREPTADALPRPGRGVTHYDSLQPVDKLRDRINVACHGAGAGASLGLLRSIFKRFDTSGDGVISRTELQKGLCLAGVDFSDADYRSVMADMDIDHDGQVSIAEFAHAICGGMDFDDSQHEYYRHQYRPNKPLAVLRDDFTAVPVSLLADVFHALRRAGHDRHVPVAVLAEELNRKALLDLTPGDLDQVAHDGALTLEALYAALFA